jgi:hypothetical protein
MQLADLKNNAEFIFRTSVDYFLRGESRETCVTVYIKVDEGHVKMKSTGHIMPMSSNREVIPIE